MHFGKGIAVYLEVICGIDNNSRMKKTTNKVAQVKINLIVILIIQIHIQEKEVVKKELK